MKKNHPSLLEKDGVQTFLASLACILGGLVIGYLVLLIIEPMGAWGAIEYIHSQLVAERDRGKAVLLVSLELDEVMSLSDRILVMYEGQLVGQLNPKTTTVAELGLYMSGAKRDDMGGDQA